MGILTMTANGQLTLRQRTSNQMLTDLVDHYLGTAKIQPGTAMHGIAEALPWLPLNAELIFLSKPYSHWIEHVVVVDGATKEILLDQNPFIKSEWLRGGGQDKQGLYRALFPGGKQVTYTPQRLLTVDQVINQGQLHYEVRKLQVRTREQQDMKKRLDDQLRQQREMNQKHFWPIDNDGKRVDPQKKDDPALRPQPSVPHLFPLQPDDDTVKKLSPWQDEQDVMHIGPMPDKITLPGEEPERNEKLLPKDMDEETLRKLLRIKELDEINEEEEELERIKEERKEELKEDDGDEPEDDEKQDDGDDDEGDGKEKDDDGEGKDGEDEKQDEDDKEKDDEGNGDETTDDDEDVKEDINDDGDDGDEEQDKNDGEGDEEEKDDEGDGEEKDNEDNENDEDKDGDGDKEQDNENEEEEKEPIGETDGDKGDPVPEKDDDLTEEQQQELIDKFNQLMNEPQEERPEGEPSGGDEPEDDEEQDDGEKDNDEEQDDENEEEEKDDEEDVKEAASAKVDVGGIRDTLENTDDWANADDLTKLLDDNFKRIGVGNYSRAWDMSDGTVAKVSYGDPCWDDYMRYCMANQRNKYLPKVYMHKFSRTKGKTPRGYPTGFLTVTVMEKLRPASMSAVKRLPLAEKMAVVYSSISKNSYYADDVLESVDAIDRGAICDYVDENKSKPVIKTILAIEKLGKNMKLKCLLDVHGDNLMLRTNGTPVFLDPLYHFRG